MTAIEFFDRTPIENVISILTVSVQKIIYIGEKEEIDSDLDIYKKLVSDRGLDIKVDYKYINKTNLVSIVDTLTSIVQKEDEVIFDLTGGTDLELVAVGIVYERFKDVKKINLQRVDVTNGEVTDCDNDGRVIYKGYPKLTVRENVKLYGGDVRFGEDNNFTYEWLINDDFADDVLEMWSICIKDPVLWNTSADKLTAINSFGQNKYSLTARFEIDRFLERYSQTELDDLLRFLDRLKDFNHIFSLKKIGNQLSFTYKNYQVKKVLTKAGNLLELRVLVSAKRLKSNGLPYYNDCLSGVFIDWDGDFHDRQEKNKDTENEIDAVLMRGLMPIFVSCKNGQVDENELYKLMTVSRRFGGNLARPVLISTHMRCKGNIDYFRQRAEDMGIKLIENVHMLSDAEFDEMIKSLA